MVDRSAAAALRRALISGNLADTQQLVAAHAARYQLSTQVALAQLLGHVYEDDRCGSGMLYLAAGCSMSCKALSSNAVAIAKAARSSKHRPAGFDLCAGAASSSGSSKGSDNAAQAAEVAAAQAAVTKTSWFSSSSSSSSSAAAAAAADAGRTEVLSWVLQSSADQPLDLSLVNARCQGVLHCCLLNGGSHNVLQQLLQLPASYPAALKPNLHLEDGCDWPATPLSLAIGLQDWHAVSLLLAAGAATRAATTALAAGVSGFGSTADSMAAAQRMIAGLMPRVTGGGDSWSSSSSSSIGGVVSGLFGRLLGVQAPAATAAVGSAHNIQQRQQLLLAAASESAAGVVSSLDEAAVAEQLQQAVQYVAAAAGVPPAAAMALLAANSYNIDKAVAAALQQASSSGSSFAVQGLGVSRAGCPEPGCGALLCLDDVQRVVGDQVRTALEVEVVVSCTV
uniref:Uncharacterized protein n=1 Tax=Tetradesmus obliquus TaxID=3088 RepID=A0A383W231_TETOB|eukprot:jgi/Sobl393_1/10218/SZX71735.1